LKIVHFSNNSLAGMPLRLSRSLNALTEHDVRLVDLERYDLKQLGWYDHDVIFRESPEEAIALAEEADILHLHNFLDLASTDFAPIDFAALQKRGKVVVRQFHSIPQLVAERMGRPLEDVMEDDLPWLVISHYPERYYPRARVVPNFLPQDDPAYRPPAGEPEYDIFFGPTKMYDAWESRWSTKGAPQTIHLMERLAWDTGCVVKWMHGKPLNEVLAVKRASRIVLDDMANGSIHLSGLEGLCQAKPVLCFLDERMVEVLRCLSGTSWHPFINVRLEDAEEVLRYLLVHQEEAAGMGREGRRWIDEHWSDRALVRHFTEAYDILMDDPAKLVRQEELAIDGRLRGFKARELPDIIYRSRARRYRA
jgi:hypothetical protein